MSHLEDTSFQLEVTVGDLHHLQPVAVANLLQMWKGREKWSERTDDAAGQIMVEHSDSKPGFTSLTPKFTRIVQDTPSSMQAKNTS